MARTPSRSRRARKPAPAAAPGLPMTGAELDAMQGEEREKAEHQRAAIMEEAVAAAAKDDLPKLGGELPEAERGPMPDDPAAPGNADPQQAAIEEAVAGIDWHEVWTPKPLKEAAP